MSGSRAFQLPTRANQVLLNPHRQPIWQPLLSLSMNNAGYDLLGEPIWKKSNEKMSFPPDCEDQNGDKIGGIGGVDMEAAIT